MADDWNEVIAARAYELWVESGYEHGHDKDHWRQAERELAGSVQTESITNTAHRPEANEIGLPLHDDPWIPQYAPEPSHGRRSDD